MEKLHCSLDPKPLDCQLVHDYKTVVNVPIAGFFVGDSKAGEKAGRGVFTRVDIPKGAIVGREAAHLALHFPALTHETLYFLWQEFHEARDLNSVYTYMFGYGFEGEPMGGSDYDVDSNKLKEYFVDASIYTFVNHGCNGTGNIGIIKEVFCSTSPQCHLLNEFDLQLQVENLAFEYQKTPVHYRHRSKFYTGFDVAMRDIEAGEEIFHNYLYFEKNREDLLQVARELRNLCQGDVVGEITAFEDNYNDWDYNNNCAVDDYCYGK